MKRLFYLTMLVAAGLLFSVQIAEGARSGRTVSFQVFYDELSPYGTWIDYPQYGHVWRPDIEGFRPYATNGYWEYTDDGWYWDSGYDWGWAPFHYGSWIYDDLNGWLWIPGYDWAPAWVMWGDVDDYFAWAPLGPFGYERPHGFYWNMVGRGHIHDRDLSRSLLHTDQVRGMEGRISVMGNPRTAGSRSFGRGPDVRGVERSSNSNITPVRLRDVNTAPADMNRTPAANRKEGNTMPVYRPQIQRGEPSQRAEPARYRQAGPDNVRPVRNHDGWPGTQPQMHRQNIERMPMHEGGGGHMQQGGSSTQGGGSRGGGHRR